MDSRDVNKAIRLKIRPLLKAAGFSRFTPRNAWRFGTSKVDVVNFQSFNSYIAECIGCTTYSFSVNLGRRFFDEHNAKLPKEYHCQFRGRVHRNFHQLELERRDIWCLDPAGKYLDRVMSDVAFSLQIEAVPWFERLKERDEVLRILNEDSETETLWGFGAKNSPFRLMFLADVKRHAQF